MARLILLAYAAACIALGGGAVAHASAPRAKQRATQRAKSAKSAKGTKSAQTAKPATSGEKAARAAKRWVGLRSLRKVSRKVPDDCSGLVRLAYQRAGIALLEDNAQTGPGRSLVPALWRSAERAGALRDEAAGPGDLVFFRETYDRNRDRRRNDGLTHVGIVESIGQDGTVVFIHRGGKGVARARLNARNPSLRTAADGKPLNDYIRREDGIRGPRLAGQLLAGYAAADALAGSRRAEGGKVPARGRAMRASSR